MNAEEIEEEATCPICFRVMELPPSSVIPKLLHCSHSFCDECLAKVSRGRKSIMCPTCRYITPLRRNKLPNNLTLIHLLEKLDKHNNSHINENIYNICETSTITKSASKATFNDLISPKCIKPMESTNENVITTDKDKINIETFSTIKELLENNYNTLLSELKTFICSSTDDTLNTSLTNSTIVKSNKSNNIDKAHISDTLQELIMQEAKRFKFGDNDNSIT